MRQLVRLSAAGIVAGIACRVVGLMRRRRRRLALMPVGIAGAAGLTIKRSRQLAQMRSMPAWPREQG